MRPHVADGYGLAGSPGSGRRCGILNLVGRNPTHESTANLVGSLQLSTGERPGPGDGSARTVVASHFDPAPAGPDLIPWWLAERLWRRGSRVHCVDLRPHLTPAFYAQGPTESRGVPENGARQEEPTVPN